VRGEELEDALRVQEELRVQVQKDLEDRLALEQELREARLELDANSVLIDELREMNEQLNLQENERRTIMEAKAHLEEEVTTLKGQYAEAGVVADKAEKDLEFEQEVRRAAAMARDEAMEHLEMEKRRQSSTDEALMTAKENLAASEEARRQAEEQAAVDREALHRKEEEVLEYRIQLGEKEAEVRHAGKMETLRCTVEIEKLRSELEWKTKMLRNECEELEYRYHESDRSKRSLQKALDDANQEIAQHKQERQAMKKMLDELVYRTEDTHNAQDAKAQEMQKVRDSILQLKNQAHEQLSALANMKEYSPSAYYEEPSYPRERRRGSHSPRRSPRGASPRGSRGRHYDDCEPHPPPQRDSPRRERRSPRNSQEGDRAPYTERSERRSPRERGVQGSPTRHGADTSRSRDYDKRDERGGDLEGLFSSNKGADLELDQAIREIEDELTIKLPQLAPSPPQNKTSGSRGVGGRAGAKDRRATGRAPDRGERGRRR